MFLNIALMLRNEFNMAFKAVHGIALGQDIKQFLSVGFEFTYRSHVLCYLMMV